MTTEAREGVLPRGVGDGSHLGVSRADKRRRLRVHLAVAVLPGPGVRGLEEGVVVPAELVAHALAARALRVVVHRHQEGGPRLAADCARAHPANASGELLSGSWPSTPRCRGRGGGCVGGGRAAGNATACSPFRPLPKRRFEPLPKRLVREGAGPRGKGGGRGAEGLCRAGQGRGQRNGMQSLSGRYRNAASSRYRNASCGEGWGLCRAGQGRGQRNGMQSLSGRYRNAASSRYRNASCGKGQGRGGRGGEGVRKGGGRRTVACPGPFPL